MNTRFRQYAAASLFMTSLSHCSAYIHADELALIADVAVAPAAPGNIDEQLRAQFEPVVKVELSFAVRACKLEGEDRKKLIAAGDKWLNQYIKDSQKQRPNRGQVQIWFNNGGGAIDSGDNDPRATIAKGIASVAKATLTPEQFAVYDRECDHREDAYREAIGATLVVRMDEKLALSAEQRQKLTESLIGGWNDRWAPPLEMFMYNNDFWPSIPDKVVSPHLTPAQWEIWTRIVKHGQNVRFGWNGNQGQVIDDVEFEKTNAPGDQPIDGEPVEGAYQPVPVPAAEP
jgi:hypothetical protein